MLIADITFSDDKFKAAVLASGVQDCEDVTEIRARKCQIRQVEELKYFPKLVLLDLTRNQLSRIDVSANPLLEELYLGNNELTSLDVSANPKLRHLEVFINDINELDLHANPLLENLYASKNDLARLDLRSNPGLDELHIAHNSIAELLLAPESHPFLVRAEQTQLPADTLNMLRQRVAAENLRL